MLFVVMLIMAKAGKKKFPFLLTHALIHILITFTWLHCTRYCDQWYSPLYLSIHFYNI